EPEDVAEDYGAVLPVEQMRVRAPEADQHVVWLVTDRIFPGTVVELALHDAEHGRVGADEGGEVAGSHHQCPHRVQRDHVRGPDADLQGGAFADQLPGTSLSEDTFPAVLLH